jgi:glyoxylase-like metal-dependent hydrolase (beta-lactamase superfamily II)
MELKQINSYVFYLPGPANIGVVIHRNKAVLIDTGVDEGGARKVLKDLESKHIQIHAIINTHAHADHFGGNHYIIRRTGALVYAPDIEEAFIRNPILEPFYLYGAAPIDRLKSKFLMAQGSKVDYIVQNRMEIIGLEFQFIPIPGHSINQMGIGVQEVFFCADAIFPPEIIEKYKILYCYDVKQQKETLTGMKTLSFKYYLPIHGELSTDISGSIDLNLKSIERLENLILEVLETPKGTEDLIKAVADRYHLDLNFEQYFLTGNTLKSYLSSLKTEGKVDCKVERNILKWYKT